MEEKEIGRMLVRADCDLKKIILNCIIRTLFCGLLVAYFIFDGEIIALTLITIVISLIVILWPLHHLKDYAEFYENGICYKGDKWSMKELGKMGWRSSSSNYRLIDAIILETDIKCFAFTYIKDGKKKYNQAYMRTLPKTLNNTVRRENL